MPFLSYRSLTAKSSRFTHGQSFSTFSRFVLPAFLGRQLSLIERYRRQNGDTFARSPRRCELLLMTAGCIAKISGLTAPH